MRREGARRDVTVAEAEEHHRRGYEYAISGDTTTVLNGHWRKDD